MARKAMFVGVVVTLALALGLVGGPAHAQNDCTSATVDVTIFHGINPCNGEYIPFTSGTETLTFCTLDAKHGSFRLDMHATGLGDQGNTYVIYEHENEAVTANAQGLFEFNTNLEFHFISLGSAPNFVLHCSQHVIVTPSGQIYLEPGECVSKCSG